MRSRRLACSTSSATSITSLGSASPSAWIEDVSTEGSSFFRCVPFALSFFRDCCSLLRGSQAVPGEGLQVVVDERQHHSLPLAELANLVNDTTDLRPSFGPKFLPFATLSSVARAMREIGGLSLLDLVHAEADTFTHPRPTSDLSQTRTFLIQLLLPFLDHLLSHDCVEYLLPRLIISPTLIPLTQRGLPNVLENGRLKDSYAVFLKAVIPSSIELPDDSLNFIPFPLFQAQAECVAHHSLGRNAVGGMDRAARSPTMDSCFLPNAISIDLATVDENSMQEKLSNEERLELVGSDEGAKEGLEEEDGDRTTHSPPPADVPHYDSQWVVELIRKSIVPAGSWGELPPSRVTSRGSAL